MSNSEVKHVQIPSFRLILDAFGVVWSDLKTVSRLYLKPQFDAASGASCRH